MLISPSLLSADFAVFGSECKRMEECGADWLHIDVMDGHFVPNITLGAPIVKKIRPYSALNFDVHLMISEPLKYIKDFADAGADLITFHIESGSDIHETINAIHECGCKAGIALKPKTVAEDVFPYLDKIDMVLVMTVEPGFGGQSFMEDMMPKLKTISEKAENKNLFIQVDGGITPKNISLVSQNGANVAVAGSSVFSATDPAEVISQLHKF